MIGGPTLVAASESTVVKYIVYKKYIENIGFLILGITLLAMITSKANIEVLWGVCLGFSIFSFIFALVYLSKCSNLNYEIRKTFIFDIILESGYIIVFSGYLLVYSKSVDIYFLPFFIIPHIFLVSVRMCIPFGRQTHTNNHFWAFFEALQILIISLKLSRPNQLADWGWVLIIIYVVVILYLIVSCLAIMGIGCFLVVLCNIPEENIDARGVIGFLLYALYNAAWKGFVFFYLLRNFHNMNNANKFGPGSGLEPKDGSLLAISIVMIVFSIIDIILLCLVSDTLKRSLSNKMLLSNKGEDVQVYNLSNPMNLNILKQGTHYFQMGKKKEGEDEDKEKEEKKAPEVIDCMICCDEPSNTLIKPCNHSGTCKKCMIKYLEGKDSCPHCKIKIKKVYVIDYDIEQGNYVANEIIRVAQ